MATIIPQCRHTEYGFSKAGTLVDRHDCLYVDRRKSCLDRCFARARAEGGTDPQVTRRFLDLVDEAMGTTKWEHAGRKNWKGTP